MAPTTNRRVILRARPQGDPTETDFEMREEALPPVGPGQFRIDNHFISLDAGFRQWMNEGSGDEYMPAMELDEPVVGLILGEVSESQNAEFPVGTRVMGRTFWEQYSVTDGTGYMTVLDAAPGIELSQYLGLLGATGLTAYIGLRSVGEIKAGDEVLISTAAGAVGTAAIQIAKLLGCRVVGMTSTDDKCRWLEETFGVDATINYRSPAGVGAEMDRALPNGIDVYFDNVGGEVLEESIERLRIGGRVILSGMMAAYGVDEPLPGPKNLFKLITQRAMMKGFMVTDRVEEYPPALAQLTAWVQEGKLKGAEEVVKGIDATGPAFCDMFRGRNRGKFVVDLREELGVG